MRAMYKLYDIVYYRLSSLIIGQNWFMIREKIHMFHRHASVCAIERLIFYLQESY